MRLHESGEDYLETILILKDLKNDVHSVDIANQMNFSKPSVTRAIKILKQEGLVIVDDDNHIKLTEEGEKKAKAIFERHNKIAEFWILNGVSSENAYRDACLMEHDISEETMTAIKNFVADKKKLNKK